MQTDYRDNLAPAIAGAQATTIPATIISRTVQAGSIGFGVAVEQGAADRGVIAFSGGDFVGVTLLDRSANGDTFAQGYEARVMTQGDIWVSAAVAVDAGDAVYLTDAGDFTNAETENTPIDARWDTSAGAGELAVIRLGAPESEEYQP